MEAATLRFSKKGHPPCRYEPKRQPQAAGREMQRRVFSLRTFFFAEKKKVGSGKKESGERKKKKDQTNHFKKLQTTS